MPIDLLAAQPTGQRKPRDLLSGAASKPQLPPELADLPVPGYEQSQPAPASASGGFNETAFAQGTSGLNEGIANVLGLPMDLTQGALRLGAAGINAATGSNIDLPVDAIGGSQSIKDVMAPAIRPESADPSNQVIRRVGQEVGASLVPAAGVVAKSATPIRSAVGQLATSTGAGAAAGTVQQVTDNPYAEMVAQILGGGAVAGATGLGRKAITPFPTSPERQAANDVLAREGVELSAGQQTGNKTLRYAESELGGQAAADLNERQLEQFTQAALSRAGISGNRASPEVMQRAYRNLGDQFDDLAARNQITHDPQLSSDLGGAWSRYTSLVNESERAPIVENTIRDVINAIRSNNGTITGEAYKSLRSRLSSRANGATRPELADALRSIQGALDDAMERSMVAAGSPDVGAWQQVRRDYHNFKILENAAGAAGESAAAGLITPAQLRSAVARQNKGGYVRGQGDFAELARAGVTSMSPLADSGTASRLAVRGATGALPATLGALTGQSVADLPGAIAGYALGTKVPNALGAFMLSPTGRNYLSNNALGPRRPLREMLAGPALGGGANALSLLRTSGLN